MTDGVSGFALTRAGDPVFGFIFPVLSCIERYDGRTASQALRRVLDGPKARGNNGDDKTLLWAGRIGVGGA